MTGEQTLAELDALHDALTRLAARRLELLAHLDGLGHAKEVGARDTVELLSLRHRLDPQTIRRDLKTATALTRYPTVAGRLPGTSTDATKGSDGIDAVEERRYGERETGESVSVLERRRRARVGETVLNPAQAAVITEILDRAPSWARAEDVAVAESELVIAARTLLPRDLRRLGRGVVNALDPDGAAPPDAVVSSDEADRRDPVERAHAAQSVWFLPGSVPDPTGLPESIRGLRIGGFLTGETAELFQVLVDAAAKPRKTPTGDLDLRTVGQRRADAFGIVLRAAASSGGEIPPHGGIKPHLSVTIPYATLTRSLRLDPASRHDAYPIGPPATHSAPGELQARRRTGAAAQAQAAGQAEAGGLGRAAGAGGAAGVGGAAGADGELVFGEPLAAGEVRRLACDAGIIPIVLGTDSEPLDVGREHRLVTPGLRRALIARDGGCVIPGCGAPPGHCDAHHLVHWADGGPTAVTNLALLCPPHHRAIHLGTWHLNHAAGRIQVTRPAWADPP